THPWRAIALWLAFVTISVAIGNLSGLHTANDIDQLTGQSQQAARWLHDAGLESPDTENVLVTARSGHLDAVQARRALDAAATRTRALLEVKAVARPLSPADGSAMPGQVPLRHDADVQPLLTAPSATQRAFPGLRVEEVGSQSLDTAVNDQVGRDLSAAA